jgi:NAD(P)-dependent dehydrogenase (short-subunit alcohol dehydrogenase family)
VVHGVRAFVPRMLAAGKQAWIANTSSIGGLSMMPIQTSYIMSKHAILSFSECLRMEMQVKNAPIAVCAILPGPVLTRIFEDSQMGAAPANERHRQIMKGMLAAEGISGYEAAKRVLPQIADGKFWVSTHPDMTRDYAQTRAEYLSTQSTPEMPLETLAAMGLGTGGLDD